MFSRFSAHPSARIVAALIGVVGSGLIATAHPADQPDAAALTLDAAVQAALARSAKLDSQSSAVAAAAAIVERAAELPDPKLRFGLENLPVTGTERYRYDRDFMSMQRIGVMQELPSGEKRSAARQRARSEELAEQAALAKERAAVRRDAAMAWFDHAYAYSLKGRLAALERDLAFELDAAAPAVTAGRTSVAEVLALGAMREKVLDRLIAQDRMIDRSRISLARWVGADKVRSPGSLPDTTAPPLAADRIDKLLDRHPAVVAMAAGLLTAQADVQRARASRTADWSIELSFARREPAFSNMVSLMFQRDLPLWPERRQDRDIEARVANLNRARALVEEARRAAEAELRLAFADHAAAQRRVTHRELGLLGNARERTAAATAAYRGGRGSLASVLEARRAETEILIDVLDAERERALAWVNLRYALLEESEHAALDMGGQQ